MPPVMQLNHISKTYPKMIGESSETGRKQVLSEVTINLNQGEIYGFVGLNGAGKTTCIKIALNLTQPDKGEVLWFGKPLDDEVFSRIGFSPEKPNF